MMILNAGCSVNPSVAVPATSTALLITATLPSTAVPSFTATISPPPSSPTAAPIEGTAATQLNVRTAPSTSSALLGMITPGTKLGIVGKDVGGNWYEILYPAGNDGHGWVTAQYVNLSAQDEVRVVGAGPSASGASGVIIQQVNVRSGPGMDFNALGTLNAKDVVTLTGKDPTGIWLQIQYPPGAQSLGWVTAAYVQANGADKLPIVASSGQVVGTGTPTTIPLTITPTLVAAPLDNDSAQSPAVNVTFSPSGVRSLIYSSDVSAPVGDPEDWIEFTPYGAAVSASVMCVGPGALKMEILQNGTVLPGLVGPSCGETTRLALSANRPVLLRLYIESGAQALQYVHYTLSIENLQP